MDVAEKKEVKVDQIDKVDIKDPDNLTGKYISKARKMVSKTYAKRALQWFYIRSALIFKFLYWNFLHTYLLVGVVKNDSNPSAIFSAIGVAEDTLLVGVVSIAVGPEELGRFGNKYLSTAVLSSS